MTMSWHWWLHISQVCIVCCNSFVGATFKINGRAFEPQSENVIPRGIIAASKLGLIQVLVLRTLCRSYVPPQGQAEPVRQYHSFRTSAWCKASCYGPERGEKDKKKLLLTGICVVLEWECQAYSLTKSYEAVSVTWLVWVTSQISGL